MKMRGLPALSCLLLLLFGCNSEDKRLPARLYEDARKACELQRNQEAKIMMERIAQRFPENPYGIQARKDLETIEVFIKQEVTKTQQGNLAALERITHALTRYKARQGELPARLLDLVPEFLDKVPETPWGHPYLYRPYVSVPIEETKGRKGQMGQRFNTKRDAYQLVCLGTDAAPGGAGLAADTLFLNGELLRDQVLPAIPQPQPVR